MVTQFPVKDGNVIYDTDINSAYYQAALADTLNHASKNISTTAVEIISANASRKTILLQNNSSDTIYLGKANTVTDSNGYPLIYGQSVLFFNVDDIYGITAAGTSDLRYLEVE